MLQWQLIPPTLELICYELGWFTIMEITKEKLKEMLMKAFKTGQDSDNDYPSELWAEQEIIEFNSGLCKSSLNKQEANK